LVNNGLKKIMLMKNFFKWFWIFIGLCVFGVSCGKVKHTDAPNIIFIIADDVSWDDIGAYGNPNIRTPNIDRLAKGGIRFDNVYLTTSSCSPSRISILTGRYPHNTGAAELHTEAPRHLLYFPELLKENGYFTALVGKWHEGPHTARAYDTLLVDKKANGEGGEDQWLSLLESVSQDQPFFFWLAPYDAHRTWSAESEFDKPYRPEDVRVPPTLVDDEDTRVDLAAYYNEISRLDDHVGQLLEALQHSGQLENTIIVFTADNPRAFPGNKTRLLDRGIKTPFIVHWPAGIKQVGAVASGMVSSIDIAPTLLEVAGISKPKEIQGRSFLSLLSQPDQSFREYIFAEHNWHDYEAYERAVSSTDYLYIFNERPQFTNDGPIDANQSSSAKSLKRGLVEGSLTPLQKEAYLYPRPREEFYDNRDTTQIDNLIQDEAYQDAIFKLRTVLEKWQEDTGDTLPEVLTKDWYHRQTGEPLPENGIRGEIPGAANRADTITNPGPF